MLLEVALRRKVRGTAGRRPLATLLLWAVVGTGLLTGIAVAAAELL